MSEEQQTTGSEKPKKLKAFLKRLVTGLILMALGVLGFVLYIWLDGRQTGVIRRSYTGILIFSIFLIAGGFIEIFPKKAKKKKQQEQEKEQEKQ